MNKKIKEKVKLQKQWEKNCKKKKMTGKTMNEKKVREEFLQLKITGDLSVGIIAGKNSQNNKMTGKNPNVKNSGGGGLRLMRLKKIMNETTKFMKNTCIR